MPGESFYEGLELGEQLAKFAAHHHDPLTRHISSFESNMLEKVGDVVSSAASKPEHSTKGGGGSIALVTGGVLALVGLGVLGRNFYLARRRDADRPGDGGADGDPPPGLPGDEGP